MRTELFDRLVRLDQSNWRSAALVRVTDEQLVMVAHHQPVALEILAKAYVRPEGQHWEPLGFLGADGQVIAVLGLSHSGLVREVRNFAVDVAHQRQGVGLLVMHSVIDWSLRSGASTLELTFQPGNEPAAGLYHRAGLRPTGEMRNGEPVWSIDLRSPA